MSVFFALRAVVVRSALDTMIRQLISISKSQQTFRSCFELILHANVLKLQARRRCLRAENHADRDGRSYREGNGSEIAEHVLKSVQCGMHVVRVDLDGCPSFITLFKAYQPIDVPGRAAQ